MQIVHRVEIRKHLVHIVRSLKMCIQMLIFIVFDKVLTNQNTKTAGSLKI